MAVKSIIDIDLKDEKFQRFMQLWDKYQQQLGKQSSLWGSMDKQQAHIGQGFQKMTAALMAQNRLSQEMADAQDNQQKRLVGTDRLWTSIARSTKSTASNIIGATKSLLQWTGLLGAIGGLLGAGGLFGIDRMAAGVADQRRSSMGLGMSIGEQKAFQVNFGRLIDPNAFLGWMNQMETDISKQGPAFSLTGGQLSGNTENDSVRMLKAIRGLAQRTPLNQLGPILGAYGLNLGTDEQRRLKSMSNKEFDQLVAGNARDVNGLNVTDPIAKKWQDFTTQMQRAGQEIWKTFVVGLAPLAKPLEHLSASMVKFLEVLMKSDLVKEGIEKVSHWLESFSGELGSSDFLDNVKQFTSSMGELADLIHTVAHPVDSWTKGVGGYFGGKMQDLRNWMMPDNASITASNASYKQYLARLDQHFGLGSGTMGAIWKQESSEQMYPHRSSKGAIGAMQLMPDTAHQYGANPYNPVDSANAAAMYMQSLEKTYKGSIAKALAAYNMGPGALDEVLKAHPKDWQRYIPTETRNYLSNVAANNPGLRIEIFNNTGGSATVSTSQLVH